MKTPPLTVEVLARHKGLDPEFLALPRVGLKDSPRGVEIPYYALDGEPIAVKLRTHLEARKGSWWPRETAIEAYGQWRLDEATRAGHLYVCEGESNIWTLWYHQLPALGLPGASSVWETLHPEHLEVDRIYVHQDPGPSGALFIESVRWVLAACQWRGRAFVWRAPGQKDPSDLHRTDPARFLQALTWSVLHAWEMALDYPKALRRLVEVEVARALRSVTIGRGGVRRA